MQLIEIAISDGNRYSKQYQRKRNSNLWVQSREMGKSLLSHKPLHPPVTPKILRILLIFSDLITKGSNFHTYIFKLFCGFFFFSSCNPWLGPSFTAWGKQYTRGVSFVRNCNYVTHPPGTWRTNKQSLAGPLPADFPSKIGIIKQKRWHSSILHYVKGNQSLS